MSDLAIATYGGVLVVDSVGPDEGEARGAYLDRTWATACAMGKLCWPELNVSEVRKQARLWSQWRHLGCQYAPDVMARVRIMDAHAGLRRQ